MPNTNTPEQTAFFQLLAAGEHEPIRRRLSEQPQLLDSFDYRNFGATPLTMACYANRPDLVELLLELGADPNRQSDWAMGPWSPLHCAIIRQEKSLAKLLLSRGARMDVHTAAGLGDIESVARLLDADPQRVNERGGDGCQPLHFADTPAVAQLLLDRGAELDGRCWDHHSTPLQYQCLARPEVARFLIAAGAQIDIFSAVACGEVALVERLLTAQPSLLQARINAAYFPPGPHHDVQNVMTFTIGADATPLHAAARANQPGPIVVLVQRGLSANVRGGYDQATPLHTAAWNNHVAAAQALLESGAEIEIRSGRLHNNTPAGWAIVAGAAEVFELFLERGAQRHPWFLDDARDGCRGRFDAVSRAQPGARERILARLEQ